MPSFLVVEEETQDKKASWLQNLLHFFVGQIMRREIYVSLYAIFFFAFGLVALMMLGIKHDAFPGLLQRPLVILSPLGAAFVFAIYSGLHHKRS